MEVEMNAQWKTRIGTAAVCALTICPGLEAAAQDKPMKPMTHDAVPPAPAAADITFMKTAAMDGMAEVEHGKLAAQQAASSDVKQFAQRMVDDHSKAGDELKGLATQKHVTLATALDAKHKAMQDKLSKLNGTAFDTAYMSHMVTAHKEAVMLFQREAKTGKDAETKAWAEKTLPTLQEHLKMAQEVSSRAAGKTGKTAPSN
jgi:putative membrane protein